MGEFHDAVSTLLEALSRGIAVIKRKKEQLPDDSAHKTAGRNLSKSLRKSRTDVTNAYSKEFTRFGAEFAVGDGEARSSLAAIIFRLNAGFVSVIERFTNGKSTKTDYTALMNLSNASRLEAISTFDQLSKRLSRSSLALVPASQTSERPSPGGRPKTKRRPSTNNLKHKRSRNSPSQALKSAGWVRPRNTRKSSSSSKLSGSSDTKRSTSKSHSPKPSQQYPGLPSLQQPSIPTRIRSENHRKSIMSFASDSTKLGEIPPHKWARPPIFDDGDVKFPIRTCYPLEPYQEPEKQKSRFMRLFRRQA